MNDTSGSHAPALAQGRFSAGIDDMILLPLAVLAVAARTLLDATLSLLIHILDYAFPIVLQVARFPLFTARILGDGVAALLKGIVALLPVGGTRRDAWRAAVSRYWSWLKQKISYRAFEAAVHHAFEGGMAWVFRTCRTLTPTAALLVLGVATLWFPVSFLAATALHAVLFAQAASLPPWMQLLHPVATILAKTKLLVLPVYPAAWPHAKKHAWVQAAFGVGRFIAALHPVQKAGYRFRQAERAAAEAGHMLDRAAALAGLSHGSAGLLAAIDAMAAWIARAWRAAIRRTVQGLSALPLGGAIVRCYAAHYDGVDQRTPDRLSRRIGGLFERWSIKFSAEYYEAKDRAASAKAEAGAPHPGAV